MLSTNALPIKINKLIHAKPQISSEKLYWSLLVPTIPIYYGDPDVKNVTKTPSFIRVLDYPSIESLAAHMQYLGENPTEYAKYHSWREDPASFTQEYLDDMALNYPGPEEVRMNMLNQNHSFVLGARKAIACRLCDEAYLRKKMQTREYVSVSYSAAQISRHIVSNNWPLPGKKTSSQGNE